MGIVNLLYNNIKENLAQQNFNKKPPTYVIRQGVEINHLKYNLL